MAESGQNKRLKVNDPASYKICVQGYLEDVWSDRLADMAITISDKREKAPESILIGKVKDQAELIGVLNGLYGLRMPVLSVELIQK